MLSFATKAKHESALRNAIKCHQIAGAGGVGVRLQSSAYIAYPFDYVALCGICTLRSVQHISSSLLYFDIHILYIVSIIHVIDMRSDGRLAHYRGKTITNAGTYKCATRLCSILMCDGQEVCARVRLASHICESMIQ